MHSNKFNIEELNKILPYIDYFLPNFEESSKITNLFNLIDIANYFLIKGVKNVIIKLGKKGAYIKNNELDLLIPAFEIEPIDTTGAGDAMVSGFISGLLDNCSLIDCVKRGNAAGSINVQFVGANGNIKSKKQLLDVLNN